MAECFKNNLGSVNQALGKYNEAKEYHQKGLTIMEIIFGEEHDDAATSYINLGSGQLSKLLDSRMKQMNTTTRHCLS